VGATVRRIDATIDVDREGAMGSYDLTDPGLLFRPDVLDDPVPLYRQLLDEAPVWEMPGTATFVVTGERLVAEAVTRTDDFSSNLTSLLFRGEDGLPIAFDMAPLGDATHVLATADPPAHTGHRKLLQPRLTPGRVAALEGEIVTMCDRLLAPLLAAGGGDLMSALADPFPAMVISRVIGLPLEDATGMVHLVLETNEILAGVVDGAQMQRAAEAAVETRTYLARHLQAAIDGVDDGVSLLGAVAGAVRDGGLTFEEAIGVLIQLVGAGTETTTSLIGIAVRRLADDQELQEHLRRHPEAIPTFLEEALRVEGPFRFHYRATRHDTSLGGVAIPAGARVLLMWAAANLDPSAYPDPDRIDLDRALPKAHLAFGRGLHFCIGAPLARLEAGVALERLLASTTRIAPDPARDPVLRPSIFLRRLGSLPLVFGQPLSG
jgi:cytochrome P450